MGRTEADNNSIQKEIEELRAGWGLGMLAIKWCRIFCLPICYPKI